MFYEPVCYREVHTLQPANSGGQIMILSTFDIAR